MTDTRITFRKVVIGGGSGLVGFVVGGIFVKIIVSWLAGSPPWELPAIVVGAIAALVIAVLAVPAIIEGRDRTKRTRSAQRQ